MLHHGFTLMLRGQSNIDINDAFNIINAQLLSTKYFDVLGKKYQLTGQLKKGVYI